MFFQQWVVKLKLLSVLRTITRRPNDDATIEKLFFFVKNIKLLIPNVNNYIAGLTEKIKYFGFTNYSIEVELTLYLLYTQGIEIAVINSFDFL